MHAARRAVIKAKGYASKHSFTSLKPFEFERDEPKPNELVIDILYCGVCHSDIHQVKNEWKNTVYPCMPGHEIVGRVRATGGAVTRHAVGDIVGVGCMIDSCHECRECKAGRENYCEGNNSWLATYNGPLLPSIMAPEKTNLYGRDNTFGGYSDVIVVREDFVLKIPSTLPIEKVAPILCAGVTTYSPLKTWGVKAGQRVAIVGLGGLGHLAVKLARAMGADVVVFTTSDDKHEDIRRLGATPAALDDKELEKKYPRAFDFVLDTIPEKHDVSPLFPLLKVSAAVIAVGALDKMGPFDNMKLAMHRNTFGSSLIGSIAETQEVLDFCAANQIVPEVEMITIDQINDVYDKVERGEVRFRYVIDNVASFSKAVAR